ncbi:MAG: hypothetical protein J5I59_06190 [Saprospiraceae bacterium]|nr:hypothetical protein [Saprospiraceae bacterium]
MTDLQLSLGTPWYFIAFCIITGLAFGIFLYRKFDFDHPAARWVRPVLFALRAMTVAIICFLLLSPVLKHFSHRTIRPTVLIGIDQSASVGYSLGKQQKSIADKIREISTTLGKDYQVVTQSIGKDLSPALTDSFNRPATDLNRFFESINEGASYQSLGAVILLSDGIFNSGPSPLFEASRIKSPIYTIGVGDTILPRDLTVRNVLHNEIGFLDDISSVQADIQAYNLKGRSATVSISQGGHTIQSKSVTIGSDDYFHTVEFQVPLSKVGLTKYVVRVTDFPGEATFSNNLKEFYIDILNSKLNIDLVAASPHPDIAALKSVIEKNKNYDLKIHYLYKAVELRQKIDLLILFQVPSTNNFNASFDNLWRKIRNKPIPTLFFLGGQSNIASFNQLQHNLQLSGNQGGINDVYPILQAGFNSFTVKDEWKSTLAAYPPLQIPFGNFTAGPNAQVLMNQRIGRVETKYPLWLFGQDDNHKTGVIAGEGLWRWKLNESAKTGKTDVFDDLINNTIRLLSTREDKRKFKVASNNRAYEINDNIQFSGELYNENYELVNTPEVSLTLNDSKNKEYKYTLNRTDRAYSLDIGQLPPGEYTYRGKVSFRGKELESSGNFSVRPSDREMYDLVADFGLLRQISGDTGGEFLRLNQLDRIVNLIRNNDAIKPVIKSSRQTDPLIRLKWIFGLLTLLLAAEWALRRYLGRY